MKLISTHLTLIRKFYIKSVVVIKKLISTDKGLNSAKKVNNNFNDKNYI